MLKKLAMTSAMAMVLAAPVMAQTTPSTAPSAMPKTTPSTMSSTTTNSSQIDAHKLIGQSIQNTADNKTVGKIDSVIMDSTGKVQQVVVGAGGFIGIGKKDVAVDWRELQVTDNGRKVTMNTTVDKLKALPEFQWPKDHARGTVWTTSERTMAPATTSSGSAGTSGMTTGTDVRPPPVDTTRTVK